MITSKQVDSKYVRKTEALAEKLDCASIFTAGLMHPHVKDYYEELSKKFNKVILRHWERANNGFKHLTLEEKEKRLNKIKPTIDRLAQLNNPNHPHIGVARELSEDVFYEIMRAYNQY
jgi:hypothetical protein